MKTVWCDLHNWIASVISPSLHTSPQVLEHFETFFETNCQTAVYLQGIQRACWATVWHARNWGYASPPQKSSSVKPALYRISISKCVFNIVQSVCFAIKGGWEFVTLEKTFLGIRMFELNLKCRQMSNFSVMDVTFLSKLDKNLQRMYLIPIESSLYIN